MIVAFPCLIPMVVVNLPDAAHAWRCEWRTLLPILALSLVTLWGVKTFMRASGMSQADRIELGFGASLVLPLGVLAGLTVMAIHRARRTSIPTAEILTSSAGEGRDAQGSCR